MMFRVKLLVLFLVILFNGNLFGMSSPLDISELSQLELAEKITSSPLDISELSQLELAEKIASSPLDISEVSQLDLAEKIASSIPAFPEPSPLPNINIGLASITELEQKADQVVEQAFEQEIGELTAELQNIVESILMTNQNIITITENIVTISAKTEKNESTLDIIVRVSIGVGGTAVGLFIQFLFRRKTSDKKSAG